jgi:hypothetical protein
MAAFSLLGEVLSEQRDQMRISAAQRVAVRDDRARIKGAEPVPGRVDQPAEPRLGGEPDLARPGTADVAAPDARALPQPGE